MASIYTPSVSLPVGLTLYESPRTAKEIWPLSLGEILEARVEAQAGPSRFLLTIKGKSMPVSCELPLQQGQRLTLRVDQLEPQVLLRIVKPFASASEILNEYAKFIRSNPEAVRDLFVSGRELFLNDFFLETLPEGAKAIAKNVANLLNTLILSESNTQKLPLNEFVASLGMMLEPDLLEVLQNKRDLKSVRSEGMKAYLLRLLDELKLLRQDAGEAPEYLAKLIEFAEKGIKTIEANQILNLHSEIKGAGYFFQVPVLLHEDVRVADLFISTENDKGASETKKRTRVLVFLNLDALGSMMVDASVSGHSIGCVFRFADSSAKDFFLQFLPELEDNMKKIGFEGVFLNCLYDNSLEARKRNCFREFFPERDAINLFA